MQFGLSIELATRSILVCVLNFHFIFTVEVDKLSDEKISLAEQLEQQTQQLKDMIG